ncbi:CobW family GTP-binding protein [Fulvivirga sedimenti]|uniref:GTP-binding protein n=1 Tax=Fulvivirga sedimenti TaxID=2879465 RepID=A0A9X1HVC7_9BACT|nr:GTP-binding protein [Fulvivirga sedimenti]MCA6078958.1 GTP-binding protein [Fulvivirga sedimenti]
MIDSKNRNTNTPIPVTILAGFLGAGKTTLLNHILTADHGRRIAVIVNDFGAINIDADLVTDVSDGVISLANGCVCCAIRADLITAVLKLSDLAERPDQIVIESSGVADPEGIYRSFLQREIRNDVLVDGVLTVVDAEQVLNIPEQEMKLAKQQVGGADLIILNKIDLVDKETLSEVENWIGTLNKRAQILRSEKCKLPIEVLLGVEAGKALHRNNQTEKLSHDHHHEVTFESWSYESTSPFKLSLLNQLLNHLPPELFRAKGFIYAKENPTKRLLLQMVGRRTVLSEERNWGEITPATQLVFIARKGTCNIEGIRNALDKCLDISEK